jgi:hypothetical protein
LAEEAHDVSLIRRPAPCNWLCVSWRPVPALALIRDAGREEGMRRLRADLGNGEWDRR